MMLRAISLGLASLAAQAAGAQGAAQAAAPPSAFAGLVNMSAGLLIVLAMIFGAGWLLRRLAPSAQRGTGTLRVVATAAVGQRERVVVVELGATWLVVGVAPGSVRALHAMPRGELPAAAPSQSGAPFAHWLRERLERSKSE